MIFGRRESILVGLMLLILAGSVVWAWGERSAAKQRLQRTAEQTAAVEATAREIRAMTGATLQPGSQTNDAVLTLALEEALAAVGVDPQTAIASTSPGVARQSARGGYVERRTEVQLQELTLRQLVPTLHDVLRRHPGVRVVGLHLTARSTEAGGTWNAGPVTFSYVEPSSQAASAGHPR